MGRLPVIFGYAGTAPFIIFMLIALAVDEDKSLRSLTLFQMIYSTVALSFLAGIHWGQAVPSGNARQLSFAMIPTIAGLFLTFWGVLADPYLPLLGAAAMFWVVYYMDRRLMPLEHVPEGYFQYRLRLTIIVSASLVASFLFSIV